MISNLKSISGKQYETGELSYGHKQYVDRLYQFDYIPAELHGCLHIKPHANDKMISENDPCFSFECDQEINVYVLYPDKQPILPKWLIEFERMRMNVTRLDSMPSNLKGYFSIYRKTFLKGLIMLNGNSPVSMLENQGYLNTTGENYCMYSVCIKSKNI